MLGCHIYKLTPLPIIRDTSEVTQYYHKTTTVGITVPFVPHVVFCQTEEILAENIIIIFYKQIIFVEIIT
jgi:hypothetical protein